MGLKFRRGTTAQQSGSLAFGEPYVNTTLGTLVIGGATGDIVLSSTGTGSTGTFGAISGSGLDITGNANIAGNLTLGGQLTIGDATSDTVNVVASLSSSLIPQTDNIFDLGSLTKAWRDLYISTGSIKMVSNGVVIATLSHNANGFQLDQGVIANGDSSFGTSSAAITSVTGSLRVSGSVAVIGEVSASTINGIGNVTTYSASVGSRLNTIETTYATSASIASATATSISTLSSSVAVVNATQTTNITAASASAWGAFQSASAYSASAATLNNTQTTNITAASASAWGAFQSASAYSASAATLNNTQTTNITTAQNSANGAFASASAYSASAVTTYAKLAVANTFTANQIVSGSITATGDVVAFSTSDRRHKNNIVLISDALGKVTKLNGVTWEWNEDVDSATKETPKTGLIAQEVQEVLPEVVKERQDGFLALDYSKMMGLMVEAIKEQQIQIAELKAEIEAIKK
jgi:hypothetical protein